MHSALLVQILKLANDDFTQNDEGWHEIVDMLFRISMISRIQCWRHLAGYDSQSWKGPKTAFYVCLISSLDLPWGNIPKNIRVKNIVEQAVKDCVAFVEKHPALAAVPADLARSSDLDMLGLEEEDVKPRVTTSGLAASTSAFSIAFDSTLEDNEKFSVR